MDLTLGDPVIGSLLDGRYRVEQRIAVGGMATVYRAVDTRLDRVVAVKVMHPALAGDPEFSARFIREAKAVARLTHANVVNVFDQGRDGQAVFLAMEYVPGRTLRDVLRERGALPARAALDILEPVLAALGAAHRAGLVHRDVKPENVLITEGGLVKVADFGLVRVLADSNSTAHTADHVLGTVAYLAPEQIHHGGPIDQRVDVYAAGILLYEMLTGNRPHTGDHPMEVMYRHLNEDVPAPSLVAPAVAPALDAIVAAATARDQQHRPHDAAELLAAVQGARRGLTAGQLDARPPASAGPNPQHPAGEPTTMLPQVNRTSVLDLPPELMVPSRPYDEPTPGRRTRRGRPGRLRAPLLWASVLAVLLALVGAASYYLSGAVYATVPDVAGQTQVQAVDGLARAGLHGRFGGQFSESVPAGQVISTDPAAGRRTRRSDPVSVVLSSGPERIAVPDVTGRPAEAAGQALTTARLAVGGTTEAYSDSVPQGSVISTTPAPGRQVPVGTPVALVVSSGMTPVPNVVGMTRDAATQALAAAGFRAQSSGLDLFGSGRVRSQQPAAGRPSPRGTTVVIAFGLF